MSDTPLTAMTTETQTGPVAPHIPEQPGVPGAAQSKERNASLWADGRRELLRNPIFVSGVLVQKFVGVKFGNWLRNDLDAPDWLGRGLFGAAYKPEYPFISLILPGIVLGTLTIATTARLTRSSLLENLRADYVRTAKSKGMTTGRVIGVHTMRNSLIPVVTTLGLSIGGYMSGAVVTEGIFRVPGVGFTVLKAILTGEPMVLLGITTVLVLIYLVLNLLVDLLYAVLDPRIRYE